MKLIIASDIHGSLYWFEKLLQEVNKHQVDNLILLGDILYHGPRNDLPKDYNPKKVIELFTPVATKVIAVKGNCDAEVDDMVLPFDLTQTSQTITDTQNNLKMFLHHGHHELINQEIYKAKTITTINLTNKTDTNNTNYVVLSGHTHILNKEIKDGLLYLNPGSISIPKEDSPNSFILYDNGVFFAYDFNDKLLWEIDYANKN